MIRDPAKFRRRRLIGLLLVCLAVRVVMPAGYMPAAIADGGPFVLCPGGLSGASRILAAQAHAAGHHDSAHGHDAGDDPHFWEFCPFGAVFGSAVIVDDIELALPEFGNRQELLPPPLPRHDTAPQPFQARAPPPRQSRSA